MMTSNEKTLENGEFEIGTESINRDECVNENRLLAAAVTNNGTESVAVMESGADVVRKETIFDRKGDYLLLGWDLDLTGRRLIDEMFHVGASVWTNEVPTMPTNETVAGVVTAAVKDGGEEPVPVPEAEDGAGVEASVCKEESEPHFTQYIMPSMNLNPVARYRHAITIVNMSRYRMLKDLRTRRILRSRSEFSGLSIFLDWLEKTLVKCGRKKAVFMWHDSQKIAPLILVKSLLRYGMLDRFAASVAGFVDTFELIKSLNPDLKAFSLRALMKSVLAYPKESNEMLGSALFRAQLTANLVEKLFVSDEAVVLGRKMNGNGDGDSETFENLQTIDAKLGELDAMKELLDRQKSLKPIFLPFLRANHWTRQQANRLRRLLADNLFDFVTLQNQWQRNGTEGLKMLLAEKLDVLNISAKDLDVAVRILDSYFDPTKKSLHYLSQELFAENPVHAGSTNNTISIKKILEEKAPDLLATKSSSTPPPKQPTPGDNDLVEKNRSEHTNGLENGNGEVATTTVAEPNATSVADDTNTAIMLAKATNAQMVLVNELVA